MTKKGKQINELMEIIDDNTPTNNKDYIELDFLTDLVVTYEKEHYPVEVLLTALLKKVKFYKFLKINGFQRFFIP